jgi:DNA-binding transcriptional MerR regulator/predicted GIY-YIG superfamily endonuclease
MDSDIFDEGLLPIKVFAELVGMTPEALRHYDRKGLFLPATRGKKFGNDYRYYAPTQITIVKMIRVLAEIGVPLQTIKELAKDREPEKLVKLLSKHMRIVADEISFLQESLSVIGVYLGLQNEGISATEAEIHAMEMPEKRIILGDRNDFGGAVGFFGEFTRFCNTPQEPKLNMSYPVGGYFESMDVFMAEPSQPSRFFSLDPKGSDRRQEGLYLTGFTRGYYGQTNDLPERMSEHAKKNGLAFAGPVFNVYLFDELSVADPGQYLLQATALVKETRRAASRRPLRHLKEKSAD